MLARAGAMSFARHGSSRVRIDATWGLPDSLLFYPHDSFRVDIGTQDVERYLRCKTDYIDVTADGQWRSHPAGSDWDWRPTLTDDEAISIAEMTMRLADHVGSAIEVMFIIGGKGPTNAFYRGFSMPTSVLPLIFSPLQVSMSASGSRLRIRTISAR
jgi:hypothetical protein